MQLYEQKFDEALRYLKRPDIINPTGDKPIIYVSYNVEDTADVYAKIDTDLKAKAKFYGYTAHVLSFAKVLLDFISQHEYHDDWADNDIDEEDLYESIRTEVSESSGVKCLAKSILDLQDAIAGESNPLIVVCDLEMIHPLDKMGRVEQEIYNQITVPLLILYPGTIQGIARSFLNIYSMDGNYRSRNL